MLPQSLPDWIVSDLSGALALLPLPALLVDGDFSIIDQNEAAENDVSRPVTGGSLTEVIEPEDRLQLANLMTRARLKPQDAATLDIRFIARDGGLRWRTVSIRPVSGINDIHLITLIDTHERKLAELETKRWAERWNHALVGSELGVWDHDFRTGEYFYSDKWKRMRGLDVDEEVNADLDIWLDGVHPDDRSHIQSFIERQNAGDETAISCEYRERRADGSYIWIECRGSSVQRGEDGKPVRIVGTDIDITARKQIEEQVTHLKRRLELALEVTKIGVFEADLETDTVLFDDTLLGILGAAGAPNLQPGTEWQSLIHPEDRDKAMGKVDGALASGDAFSNEFRIFRKNDGALRHIRARSTPYRDQAGRRKIVGANWDVTDEVTIRAELETAHAQTEARNQELERARIRIEHNALHDFLTDLPNRRYLEERILTRHVSINSGIFVLHIDLDRFKQINDTLGHRAGDFMLQHASKVLRECTHPEEFVARIGGDEFVIVAPYSGDCERLEQLASSIIEQLQAPVYFDKTPCRIGASVGIAYDERPDCDAKALLQNADIALYRAKSRGRNRSEVFTSELHHKIITAKRASDEILDSLERRDFFPFYQPQFSARTLDIVGAETLARWRHPTRGVLAPVAFLKIAEDLDVVSAIDAMILEKAVEDLKLFGADMPKLSVNVSVHRLSEPDLLAKLDALTIPPDVISFELLETIFLDDCDDTVLTTIEALRARGIGVEIDDFGSGHASIIGVLKVAPSVLKIDRALVTPITQGAKPRQLVSSIIGIGHSLGITVVAEGVETWEHVAILKDLGCDILQGYALAKPMPASDLRAFIRRQDWRP